jgi:hypothetical protein
MQIGWTSHEEKTLGGEHPSDHHAMLVVNMQGSKVQALTGHQNILYMEFYEGTEIRKIYFLLATI